MHGCIKNELKTDDKGKNKYPFEFITRDKKEWACLAHYYSTLVKKQLMNEDELDKVIEEAVVKNFTSKLKRIWHRYKCKKDFKRVVAKPYIQRDYIAGTDMSNVELKYLKGKI